MAKDYKREDILYPDQKIIQSELVHEMQTSYIEYAMSVIVGRALPDVRDGLKPVHRRILYTMHERGNDPSHPYRKSADTVGAVLGAYHPHGDASVYDAMVRLAQDFSLRYPLVDGQGNFGSVDGDPPAAYRYTEARMSKIACEMLTDIDKDTIDWDPNFDETKKEPHMLPSRFPNLLVNGSQGIAVGMATNIPPHNLREVVSGMIALIDDPEIDLAGLMEHIKGPDFPTGGVIMGRSGIRAAYATGRGKITLRGRAEIVEKKIANMELYEHAHFDSYGVGENLITSASDPVFGGVYKLVAVKLPDGTYQPKMKCSDSASKAIIPGKKMPWRLYDENGQAQCDLIAMDGEVIEAGKPVKMVNLDPDAIERTITITPTRVKRLLVPHILNGELAIELPGIAEKKAYIAKQLTEETWETELRIEMPHKHYVNMTPAVAECRAKMYSELHGGKV